MKLKIFTLRLSPSNGTFDDKELVDFQLGKEVLEVSEHFLVHEKAPTLILVLSYRDLPDGARPARDAERKDWRAELDPPRLRRDGRREKCAASRKGLSLPIIYWNGTPTGRTANFVRCLERRRGGFASILSAMIMR